MSDGKVSIHDLTPRQVVRLAGDEPWLARLYNDFPAPKDQVAPRLTGELTLVPDEAGSVTVTGKLDYAPYVPCSRCTLTFTWPLALDVSVRFLPEDVNPAPKERNLSTTDLDDYYLDGDDVDLEQLVHDTIHTSLPSQILAVDEGKSDCRICHADLRDERVYESGKAGADDAASDSPFAALKGLKLPN